MHRACLKFIATMVMSCASAVAAVDSKPEYISDRPDLIGSFQQSWGTLGLNVAAHMPGTTPLPLQANGKRFAKGLGAHAAGEIIVLLDGKYATFEVELGVQISTGSVVFQVYADDELKFDSGVLGGTSDAKPVKVSVAGASVLKLIVNDGGDGIINDLGNWLNPILTPDPAAAPRPADRPDMAPFARVITCDPNRMEGARTDRLQEFHEEDVQLDLDVPPSVDGTYRVPVSADGRGVLGLRWLERRRLMELAIEFAAESTVPATAGVQVQAWFMSAMGASPGGSAWQGKWVPLKGDIQQADRKWVFNVDWLNNNIPAKGILKIRWVFPPSGKAIVVKRMLAFTDSRTSVADVELQMAGSSKGQFGEIDVYNGKLLTPDGEATHYRWDLASPARIKVRYCETKYLKTDRTVLRLKLPAGGIGVAVDDIVSNSCVWVPDFGLFATRYPAKIGLDEYKRSIEGKKTVLSQVRELPDQTLEHAMKAVHPDRADWGPTLLSLACSNRKYVIARNGSINFEQSPTVNNLVDHALGRNYNCNVNPRFGNGDIKTLERHLQGGWLPIEIINVKNGGVVYRQRSYVAPYGKAPGADGPIWANDKPLFVSEITVTNPLDKEADATIALDFVADPNGRKMSVQVTDYGVLAQEPAMAMVSVNTQEIGPLKSDLREGVLTLSGRLPANASARCVVYIPGWEIEKGALSALKADDALVAATEKYWNDVMGQAVGIDIPDEMLTRVIKASQVHCFLAARNVKGRSIAPWIGSISYGPLDSEAQSVIRGMAFMGHEDFARRSLDYFISRYNRAGYLQPTYTLMGTGWNLWNIGEFHDLYNDAQWMKKNAPEVARVCDWIMRQRAKTMKPDARGERLPEYGLNPPGAMADWEVFSYYFYSNGYFYAGLNAASKALASIGFADAGRIVENAADYRKQIERAFHYVQALAPVFPLKNGTWVPEYPTQLYCPSPTDNFYRGEDFGRSWCYDVELGSHHLVPQGVLDPRSKDVEWLMDHMEDVQFLSDGWFAYPNKDNEKNPFDFGGFAKVQPYYARNAEVCAMRDDVKPFIRSYFNTLPTLLNREDLSLWEHFAAGGGFNKTHETGYFLHQTRLMLVQERGDDLWLAPFVTSNWLKDGMSVAVTKAPTRFGPVSYRIHSSVSQGSIEATIDPPTRTSPHQIVLRIRHPEGKPIRKVTVNGRPHKDFDTKTESVRIASSAATASIVKVEY